MGLSLVDEQNAIDRWDAERQLNDLFRIRSAWPVYSLIMPARPG